MAATHTPTRRPRKTRTRPRRRNALPQLTWGGAALTAFLLYVGIRTWPVQAAIIGILIAAAAIVRAIRPRWLNPIIHRAHQVSRGRAALPARGRRTIDAFHRLTPARFEQAIAELAHEHPAVHTAHAVGQANDRGADVLVHLTDGRRILIQCKKYRHGNNIGSETVQTINGVYRDIHHCHQAVIVTTAAFTQQAGDTNAMLPQPIRLVDGTQLVSWANGGPAPWN
ncbi:restriction endonuclease [Streptomyces sp. NBC_00878]|uniref:restriction endonuclease n=1 Tax=Streptomyces sp. NBC_00878 TaxID=2975854 RepID=UPI002255A7B0|nr:restriction endonuclease [Streptomyces sp. NBC_00878]MCX4911816.1 restriction endonuclease [Streptomyces sp. NBC_00878]